MAFSAGAITGTIKLNTGPFMDSLGSVRSSLSRFASMTARIGGAISAALGGVGAGAAIKLAADFEQTNVAFSTLLGSAAKAKAMLGDLQQFAMSTPFEFTGLTQSAKLFLAMGFDAKKLIPTLKAVGDISAGLNLGDSGLQHIIMILGQMKSTGTIHAQDMLQLTQMGIPAWNLMADTIGKSVAETKQLGMNGKLSADQFIQAFIAMKGPLAKFNGLMGEESKTLGGLFSNLKDTITNTLRDVGQALVTKLNLKEVVANWTSGIAAMKDKLVDFAVKVADGVKSVTEWIKANQQAIKTTAEWGAGIVAAAYVLPPFIESVKMATSAIKGLTKAYKAMMIAEAAIASFRIGGLLRKNFRVFASLGAGGVLARVIRGLGGFIRAGKILAAGAATFGAVGGVIAGAVAVLGDLAAAFVQAKMTGQTFGAVFAHQLQWLGFFSNATDKARAVQDGLAKAMKDTADAVKQLTKARESGNMNDLIAADKNAIAKWQNQLQALRIKQANMLNASASPRNQMLNQHMRNLPAAQALMQHIKDQQALLRDDIMMKNAAAWNAWTESLRNDFGKVKSTALAAFDAIRRGLEKIADARKDVFTKIALFGASSAQREKYDILKQAHDLIQAAKKLHILTPKLRDLINSTANAQIADIGKDQAQQNQPPKMTPLLMYGSAEQQRLAYMRSRGMMGQVGGTPQQEQKKQTKEQEKSNDLLERINNSLQKQNAGQSGGDVINWGALFG